MNCKFTDLKIYWMVLNFIDFLAEDDKKEIIKILLIVCKGLPGYLLLPIVLSKLPMGYPTVGSPSEV